ncbi:MAG: glycosyltransferase [Acidobacteriota bacterium]
MKVALVGPAYPLRGGIAHHTYSLQKELTARHHQVEVISYRKLYPRFLFPGRTTVDTSELKFETAAQAILDPLDPRTWIKAFRAIKKFSPDVTVIEWWNPFFAPVAGALAAMLKMAGIKTIFECHNVFPHERSLVDFPLLSFAFASVERFITHSAKDREDLLSIKSARVAVVPLPAVAEFVGGNGDRSGRRILFFGIVRKYKGLDVLLRAMPRVLSEVECNLVVAGEFYDSVRRYEEIIRSSGIEKNVRIENRYIANEEVPALFEEADVLVLPYLSATQSGVARIAIMNRLPIIASRTGGLMESVGEDCGLLVPPGDARALADALIRYFKEGLGPLFSERMKRLDSASSDLARIIEEMA